MISGRTDVRCGVYLIIYISLLVFEHCPSLLVTVIQGDFVNLPTNDPIHSLAEEETVLLCHYKPTGDNVVVQVTWYKEKPDGNKDQIITAHHTNGQTGQCFCSSCGHFAFFTKC